MKKILLIHGWNYRNYTSQTKEKDAWHNRPELVKELKKKFEVYTLNLPGFCGEKEPNTAWDLNDYAKYIDDYLKSKNLKVDYILGYSFGGAIAVTYYLNYGKKEKLILVSPAISRNHDKSRKFIKTPKCLTKIRNIIRDIYLIKIVKTNEMVYGTKFLRNTYQKIVRVDLKEELIKIPSDKLLIIYGEKDNMVKPNEVNNFLDKKYKKRVHFIKEGDHNIGKTHYKKIIEIINNNY